MSVELRQLVYISDARYGLAKEDIEDILATSRRNNGEADVTGMLLYSSGIFIQALEGEPERIAALYAKISDDRRHDNVDLISDQTIEERGFSSWAMGFVERPPEELGKRIGIDGALDRTQALARLSEDQTLAGSMLRDFAENAY